MKPWLERYADAIFRRSADVNHDLKTPLNIAVLNLELLKMRLARLAPALADDEKLRAYASSVEIELRRMAKVFDAVFQHGTPPDDRREPEGIDLAPLLAERFGARDTAPLRAALHADRGAELIRLLALGASKIFGGPPAVTVDRSPDGSLHLKLSGAPASESLEMGKLFKFYYTDQSGNPEISLATARLIAESYGGTLDARAAGNQLFMELVLPAGDQ
ncbi:MAG TPA: histidine kinase dimerization/phospho-acceptor domain-containing protein [Thermoanaerobaculia bacterium]|nr:histidine kinase dimerization/phospho-acceptor domain-containing protein [Thermoanaerobaculia bacterium]